MRSDVRARAFDSRTKGVADIFVGNGGRLRCEEVQQAQDLTGSAATITLTDFIPTNVWLWGVFVHVLEDITGTVANFDVGDGSDVDLWGAGLALTAGTQSSTADFTAAASMGTFGVAARDVVLQDDGVLLFTGGLVRIGAIFSTGSAEVRR